jgi:hypothetical protein
VCQKGGRRFRAGKGRLFGQSFPPLTMMASATMLLYVCVNLCGWVGGWVGVEWSFFWVRTVRVWEMMLLNMYCILCIRVCVTLCIYTHTLHNTHIIYIARTHSTSLSLMCVCVCVGGCVCQVLVFTGDGNGVPKVLEYTAAG